eukprot:674871-Lingulodinium_polyedra.AAC.1
MARAPRTPSDRSCQPLPRRRAMLNSVRQGKGSRPKHGLCCRTCAPPARVVLVGPVTFQAGVFIAVS